MCEQGDYEYLQILQNERHKAMCKVVNDVWQGHFRRNLELLEHDLNAEWMLALDEYKRGLGKQKVHTLWTINPRMDTDLGEFMKKIIKATKKKWVKHYIFSIEQRGKTDIEMGRGIHCHMYVEVDKKKRIYECRREMYNTFKHLVGNRKHVMVSYAKDPTNFIKYCMGIKKDEEKDDMIKYDKLWRKKNELEDYYTNINFESNEGA